MRGGGGGEMGACGGLWMRGLGLTSTFVCPFPLPLPSQHVEKDPAFERRFQPVLVGEPSVPATISILRGLKERYESHHGIRITDAALVLAAKLADRYIQVSA